MSKDKGQEVINVKALRALCKSSPTAKAIFTHFSTRERSVRAPHFQSYVFRLHKELRDAGVKVSDDDYIAAWEVLQALGLGNAVKGKTGIVLYFHWFKHPKDVGLVALGKNLFIRNAASPRMSVVAASKPAIRSPRAPGASQLAPITRTSLGVIESMMSVLTPEQKEQLLLKLLNGGSL